MMTKPFKRVLFSLAIIVGFVIASVLVDAIVPTTLGDANTAPDSEEVDAQKPQEENLSSNIVSRLYREEDVDDVTDSLLADYSMDPPQVFMTEIMSTDSALRFFGQDGTYALIFDESADKIQHYVKAQLTDKGWSPSSQASEDSPTIDTWTKSSGIYHWLAVQFFSFSESTTIVLSTY